MRDSEGGGLQSEDRPEVASLYKGNDARCLHHGRGPIAPIAFLALASPVHTVIHVLDNLAAGGCQTCLRALAGYSPKKRRHLYVSLRTQRDQIDLHSSDVTIFPGTSRYSPLPAVRLLRLSRSAEPSILHCYLFKAQVCGLLVHWMRPSTLLIFHEGGRVSMREHEPWWEPISYRLFLRLAARWVDLFIANSKHTLLRLQKIPAVGRRPGVVIYNSILDRIKVPDAQERGDARSALSLPADAFVFGFAGRIIERKGWREFVECAKRFRNEPGVHWIIAGDGPEDFLLKQIRAEERLTKLTPLGFQQDMESFYRSLDVCIIPSHWEPHGLVQLEAQSYGLPVIAANVAGMNETLTAGQNALLFSPKDLPSLFRHVENLLHDRALLASLSQGSISNARKFTVKKYHDSLEACYESLERPAAGGRGPFSQ